MGSEKPFWEKPLILIIIIIIKTGGKIIVSLTKFIADAFFLQAKIVKTTKTQISQPCFSCCNRGKVKES
jgi:hypothetical protein